MAQKIFTTYRAAVNSFPLGEKLVGLLKPGRYNGYDEPSSVNNDLNIVLGHSGSIPKTDKEGNYTPEFGALIMPTGIVIHEYDNVEFSVVHNSGGVNTRIDYLICEHEYEEVEGSTPAYYSVIQGPSNGEEPVIPNPSRQVLIMKIIVPPDAYLFEHLSFEKSLPNLLGDSKTLTQIILETVILPIATISEPGIVQLATITETQGGVNFDKAVTPAGLANRTATTFRRGIVQQATDAEATAKTDTEKFVTPYHLGLLQTAIQHIIDNLNIDVPDASLLVKGIIQLASATEVNEGTDNLKAITPATLNQRIASTILRGLIKLATPEHTYTNWQDAVSLNTLHSKGIRTMLCTSGTVVTALTTIQNDHSSNSNFNYYDINPPAGYTINDLHVCIPSIAKIVFGGTVDGNDVLWCRWEKNTSAQKVRIYGANSEQNAPSWLNYLCIWWKTL